VVIAVPHAGRDYPAALLANARVPKNKLEGLEDRHAEQLIALARDRGASTIVAHSARALIDLNRDPREIDPDMIHPAPAATLQSAKMRAGLGLFPRRLSGIGELWRGRIDAAEAERRIDRFHRPYHQAVTDMMDDAAACHGETVLIDCHSMPSLRALRGPGAPQIVLGDLYGRSADQSLVILAADMAERMGLRVARNAPYAGGYTLERHGEPRKGRHAFQIEFDRSLYLDSEGAIDSVGLDRCQRLLMAIAIGIAEAIGTRDVPMAAE
jgi:N-formylglutamate amidohydrolase